MSYILDALQKSQSEQAAEGVALRPHKEPVRKPINTWLSIGLVGVLLCNAALLVWLFVLQEPSTPAQSSALEKPARIPVTTEVEPEPAPSAASAAFVEEPAAPKEPIRTSSGAQSRTANQAQLVPVPLNELPQAEQSLYNGLTYSTHIYTDDPSLCAIVIDGQRLMAGDAFKGLTVVAITEVGVVFEEVRQGQRRQVEVSILEQWDSQ